MAKILIPRYGNGTFESLRDTYQKLKKDPYGWRSCIFEDIVWYNFFYRDILREFMCNEVP